MHKQFHLFHFKVPTYHHPFVMWDKIFIYYYSVDNVFTRHSHAMMWDNNMFHYIILLWCSHCVHVIILLWYVNNVFLSCNDKRCLCHYQVAMCYNVFQYCYDMSLSLSCCDVWQCVVSHYPVDICEYLSIHMPCCDVWCVHMPLSCQGVVSMCSFHNLDAICDNVLIIMSKSVWAVLQSAITLLWRLTVCLYHYPLMMYNLPWTCCDV